MLKRNMQKMQKRSIYGSKNRKISFSKKKHHSKIFILRKVQSFLSLFIILLALLEYELLGEEHLIQFIIVNIISFFLTLSFTIIHIFIKYFVFLDRKNQCNINRHTLFKSRLNPFRLFFSFLSFNVVQFHPYLYRLQF